MVRRRHLRAIAVVFLCIGVLTGCARKNIHAPVAPEISANNNSYIDLQPGWTLRIVVPLLRSGGAAPTLTAAQTNGNTISLSAADLIGYEVAYYGISGKTNGAVRLKFASAAITKDGKTEPQPDSPTLPFLLPEKTNHIRLIYLVRVSEADHNMAIVASKHLNALNRFTKEVQNNPDLCGQAGQIFCSWVPTGIAVRPEAPEAPKSSRSAQP